ncbi:MAG: nucleoside kinase [candidate division WOR-3 bacterium]
MSDKILDKFPRIGYPVTLAKVDNQYTFLGDPLPEESLIEFLDIRTSEGMRTYERTLVFLLDYVAKKRGVTIKIEHSYGNAIFGRFLKGRLNLNLAKKEIEKLIKERKNIEKLMLPKLEAIQYLRNREDDVNILLHLAASYIPVYKINDFPAYFAGPLLPNTGFISVFDIKAIKDGFLIILPSKEEPFKLGEVEERKKLFKTYKEAKKEAEILRIWDAAQLNRYIINGEISEILNIAEVLHSEKITEICRKIIKRRKEIHIVLIGGPSSSGKTTFSKRLGIHLRSHGFFPVCVSLDDYFLERSETPQYKDGTHFFDSIYALDLKLFREHILNLLKGEKVRLPRFNFKTGKREYQKKLTELEENSILIVEGLHTFNPEVLKGINVNPFLIYVSPLTQLNINRVNRIPTRDLRLLRRIFRDTRYRGHDAEYTLKKWESVKDGEEQFIFPYQERADVMFNSSLVYELAVLKAFLETPLRCVPTSSPFYCEALRLLTFLSHFLDIQEKEIPRTSILREFIGGSAFLY